MHRFKFWMLAGSSLAVAISLAPPVLAQATTASPVPTQQDSGQATADSDRLGEIVVTAQKRKENLQKVPLSISTISSVALQQEGITSVVELNKAVPGLNFQKFNGIVLPFLRGIGNSSTSAGNESSVAVYADGVYFARLPSSFLDLNNVERVEVLKGPQGTLFGRNSTGGVINVITRDPSHDTEVLGSVSAGRFSSYQGSVYATTGLSDKVAADISVSAKTDEGFGRNLTLNSRYGYEDSILVRSKLLFTPTSLTRITLSAFYSGSSQSGNKAAVVPGTYAGTYTPPKQSYSVDDIGFYNTISGVDVRNVFRVYGGALRVEQDLDFARLVSISAYSQLRENFYGDGDYGPRPDFNYYLGSGTDIVTQEFQLLSKANSKLNWIVGAYYYNNLTAYNTVNFSGNLFGGATLSLPGREHATSAAGFAQATYEVLPSLKLTGGIRYTQDVTSASGKFLIGTLDLSSLPGSRTKVNKVSFRAVADYQLTPDILTYASFNRGFKSGNYNILTYQPTTPDPLHTVPSPTRPEGIDAYEIGFKSQLFDNRLRFNAAIFQYNVTNPQVQLVQNATVFFSNAGASRVRGGEFDVQAVLFTGFTARGGLSYLDAVYTDYGRIDPVTGACISCAPTSAPNVYGAGPAPSIVATGKQTPFAAKVTFTLGGDYVVETSAGTLTLSADLYHNSGYFFEPDNFLRQKAYELLSAQVKLAPSEHIDIRLWGRNLLNQQIIAGASTQVPVAYPGSPTPPRTYGVAVDFKF